MTKKYFVSEAAIMRYPVLFVCLCLYSLIPISGESQTNVKQKKGKIVSPKYNPQPASIIVYLEGATDHDTLDLLYYKNVLSKTSSNFFPKIKIGSTRNNDGVFVFKIDPIAKPAYISLTNKIIRNETRWDIEMLSNYLLEPGDDIRINIKKDSVYTKTINKRGYVSADKYYYGISFFPNYSFYFSGKGSEKYKCRYEADRITSSGAPDQVVLPEDEPAFGKRQIASKKISLDLLEKYRPKMTFFAYELMRADFIGHFEESWYNSFRMAYTSPRMKTDSVYSRYYATSFGKKEAKPLSSFSKSVNEISANYCSSIIQKEKVYNLQKEGNVPSDVYYALKEKYSGVLLDKLVTIFLFENSRDLPDLQFLLDDASETIQTAFYKDKLSELKKDVAQNSPAYEFALPDTSGNIIKLNDFKGKVVFMDFWYNKCGACVDYYMYQLKEVETKYKDNKDVVFVTVNIDTNKKNWLDALYDKKHTSLDVVNLYSEGLGTGHPIIRHYKITSYPRPILIDQNGRIFSVISKDLRNGKKLDELIETLLKSNVKN